MKKLDFKDIILNDESPAEFKEAFNTLRTNLCCLLGEDGAKVIAITAGKRGEGVSSAAVNLSISFANIGKKVLLIDADMHSASASEKLELKSVPGLSDCLKGSELKSCLSSCRGIDVLPAGTACANPADLLDSKAMAALMAELKKSYDFIIVSLAPVGLCSDALIVSKYADGFVPVVCHDMTRHSEVRLIIRNLSLAHCPVLGFLYNGAPLNKNKI